ncbi:MAG: DUF3109 family protein [Bacteroidales bacterium]|nr:DUF3109 family protein [Bacteroidales bacterium]
MDRHPSFIQIDDALVSSEVLTTYFACDYARCKGACCIVGDSGAPLDESELEALEINYPHYEPLMSEGGKAAISRDGFFTIDRDGDLVTPLVADTEECAYCHFDGDGNCLCAIESQWQKGLGNFRKPISCQLYPIRLSRLSSGLTAVNLHRWDICKEAFEKGKAEGIKVYRFLREPIIRYFGEEFFNALCEAEKWMEKA